MGGHILKGPRGRIRSDSSDKRALLPILATGLSMDSLPYNEPHVATLLALGAFFIALHVVAWPLDKYCSCGLLGQIFVGMVWGSPLGAWLPIEIQQTIVILGYIGLILLVYEGSLALWC